MKNNLKRNHSQETQKVCKNIYILIEFEKLIKNAIL